MFWWQMRRFLLTLGSILLFATIWNSAANEAMNKKPLLNTLEEVNRSKHWKTLQRDASEILHLYSLPFFTDQTEVLRIQNPNEQFIGRYVLAPDHQHAAVAVSPREKSQGTIAQVAVYGIDSKRPNAATPLPGSWSVLVTFLGNEQLLLLDQAHNPYVVNSKTGDRKALHLGTPLGALAYASAPSTGDCFVYDVGNGFILYDVTTQTSRKLDVEGTQPILSPDGQRILFRRGGFTGSYYLMDSNGEHETIVLPEQHIRELLHGSGSYVDMGFLSWSPDGRFLLLGESSDAQKGRLFILNIATKELIEITAHAFSKSPF